MKIKPIYLYIGIVVLFFMFLHQCQRAETLKESSQSKDAFLKDTISYYENSKGQLVAQKAALQGDKKTLEVLLSKQIDSTGQLKRLVSEFKNVDAAGNITTITRIDTIEVPFEVPVPFEFERTWQKTDPFYFISGMSNQDGNTITDIEIPNKLSFAIGEKKTGFFKSEYRIEAVNSNPYISTIGLDSYTLKLPKKRFGVGLYVGYGLSENLTLSPNIGIGLSYSIIQF